MRCLDLAGRVFITGLRALLNALPVELEFVLIDIATLVESHHLPPFFACLFPRPLGTATHPSPCRQFFGRVFSHARLDRLKAAP